MNHAQLMEKFRTVHAINVTPFRDDRGIDYALLEQNVEFLIANGLEVIVPCGNTGEFHSLSVEEAKTVTRFVVEKVGGRATVLAGIGHDLQTAREMASFAQDVGADAVMVHQPAHPYLMAKGLVRYYTEIARSIGIGIALYVRHEAVGQGVLDRVTALDNVLAIKYAINDLPVSAIWCSLWRTGSCGSAARRRCGLRFSSPSAPRGLPPAWSTSPRSCR